MDRIVDLVQQLEPKTAPPSIDVQARQRDALLRSMAADAACTRPSRWRPRHSGWFVAIASVAAAAIVAAIVVGGSSPSPRPPAATSAVLTAITRALANTGDDIEEVQSTVPGAPLSTTSWVDLATGACRTDSSLNGQPSMTIFVEHANAVFVDYGLREWWIRSTEGVTCKPLTPQSIEHGLNTGNYTIVGHATLEGQQSLKLESTATTSGLHPETKTTTLWVNATTHLPIQSASADHLTEQTVFTWLPATSANRTLLNLTVPADFQQVGAPPAQIQSSG